MFDGKVGTKINDEIVTKKDAKLFSGLWFNPSGPDECITNPFSGESCMLPPIAVALYDYIKGAELLGHSRELANGLHCFAKFWPSEYYTLLD